jgi:hypothetical protein
MPAHYELPLYKPSGAGPYVDIKNIMKSQAIAWGGFKARFRRDYEEVAGTHTLRNQEVFNRMEIQNDVGNKKSKKYKFLKFFGMEEDELKKINDFYNKNKKGVDKIYLQWKFKQQYTEDAWLHVWKNIFAEFEKFDRVVFSHDLVGRIGRINENGNSNKINYPELTNIPFDVKMKDARVAHDTSRWFDLSMDPDLPDWVYGIKVKPKDEYIPIKPEPCGINPPDKYQKIRNERWLRGAATFTNRRYLWDNVKVQFYKNGVDITRNFPVEFQKAILYLFYTKKHFFTRKNIKKNLYTRDATSKICDPAIGSIDRKITITRARVVEYYEVKKYIPESSMKNLYKQSTASRGAWLPHGKPDGMTKKEWEEQTMPGTMAMWVWGTGIALERRYLYKYTNGLFIPIKRDTSPVFEKMSGFTFISDGGLSFDVAMRKQQNMSISPGKFGYYCSLTMELNIKKKKRKWYQKLIAGLIGMFLGLLDAILNIFMKIPILKQVVTLLLNVIGKIFGLSIEGAKVVLKKIIGMLLMAILSFIIPGIGFSFSSIFSSINSIFTQSFMNAIMSLVNFASQLTSFVSDMVSSIREARMVDKEKALADQDYKMRVDREKMEDPRKKAFNGTMGTFESHQTMDEIMYDAMFNPFDTLQQAVPVKNYGMNVDYLGG